MANLKARNVTKASVKTVRAKSKFTVKPLIAQTDADAAEYAFREYGVTPAQMARVESAAEEEYQRGKRAGTLVTMTSKQLKKMIHENSPRHRRTS